MIHVFKRKKEKPKQHVFYVDGIKVSVNVYSEKEFQEKVIEPLKKLAKERNDPLLEAIARFLEKDEDFI